MKRCNWCDRDATRRLLIATSGSAGEIVTAWFCTRHFDQFIADQTRKGHLVAPPIRIDPTGETPS